MRRSTPLRRTNLRAVDFRMIGEIVVLSGMIEDTLKRMPLKMLRVIYVPGVAMTTHLNTSALCDMVLAILPYFLESDDLTTEVENMVALVRSAAMQRNAIVHGPFDFTEGRTGSNVSRFTARSKLKHADIPFDRGALNETLALHKRTWQAVAECIVGMSVLADAREELGISPLRQDYVQRANRGEAAAEAGANFTVG